MITIVWSVIVQQGVIPTSQGRIQDFLKGGSMSRGRTAGGGWDRWVQQAFTTEGSGVVM